MIDILWSKSKFFIFDHVESENWPYFAKTEKWRSNFFVYCKVSNNLKGN